jgi:hypothetical protein
VKSFVPCALAALAGLSPFAMPLQAGQTSPAYYGLADFSRVPKIDAHVHVHGPADAFMAQAIADDFRILAINVDYPDFPPITEQERDAVSLRARYPGRVAFAGTFSVRDFQSPDWSARTLHQIEAVQGEGAVGIKIWKNVGMSLRDADGRYVMLDDPRFAPVLDYLALHQLNCWLPMEKMTVRSDREYFAEHPQYYMYRHPEMPSHQDILAARDRMLKAHPELKLDAVHLASLEWDVGRVADFLDRFPAVRVDLAARLVHLEYQATKNPQKVRRFLIRYQDRVLYGSDDSYGPADDDAAAVADIHHGWLEDWRFLATSEPMRTADFEAEFHGLHLPRNVVDKIYRRNAQALFPGAWAQTDGKPPPQPP